METWFPLGVAAPARDLPAVPADALAPQFTLEVLLYGLAVFGVFLAAWVYYDRRDRSFFDVGRRKISFHCIRCDHLYTQPDGTETAPCPKCGHENVRLKF